MAWLIDLIVAVLRVLLPWIVNESRPTAEDAHPDRQTRERLRTSIRRHWMVIAFVLPILLFAGCARTIYVPHGTPVRLRETVQDVKVWVKDSDGKPVAGRMDLYEGWYALPLEDEE